MPGPLTTRLTRLLDIEHPILLAPMDKVAGGRLAAAVSAAGGLGLIGGGYADPDWMRRELVAAGNQPVGAGFITWSLAKRPEVLDFTLSHGPRAIMFSFGDATEFVARSREAGAKTIWQVQRLDQARLALDAGVDILVAQGQEAGGHAMDRGLTVLLPAVRDLAGPEQIVVAAGGIADGRGLAAALMLGADGVLMGTRFYASEEASGPRKAKDRIAGASGDETLRTKVFDLARDIGWPSEFTGRVLGNEFSARWHDDIAGLQQDLAAEQARYSATDEDDFSTRPVIAGEAADLIGSVEPAGEIVHKTAAEAASLIGAAAARFLT